MYPRDGMLLQTEVHDQCDKFAVDRRSVVILNS